MELAGAYTSVPRFYIKSLVVIMIPISIVLILTILKLTNKINKEKVTTATFVIIVFFN